MRDGRYGVGIVGTGAIAAVHALAADSLEDTRLVACYNHNRAKGDAFAGKYGIVNHASLEDFMADEDVDIVMVATPSASHLEACMSAIAHGKKALLVEKPLEATTEACDRIIKAADEKGVVLSGIFQSRFFPSSVEVKKALDEGRFGRIVLVDAQFKWYRSQEYYDSTPWHGNMAIGGGGVLMNQGIHAIDLMSWFGGDVESISSFGGALGHERIDVEDTSVASLRFTSGALGVIEGTTATWPGFLKKVEICGSDGSVILEDESIRAWSFKDERPEDEEIRRRYATSSSAGGANDPMAISSSGHVACLKDVVDALKEGRRPLIDGLEARKAVAIVEACYRSAASGGAPVRPR